MGTRRWILWQGLIAPSMERFIATRTDRGFELSGLILQAHQDVPYIARYVLHVDEKWRTQSVKVELEDGGQRRLSLTADGEGHWSRDGQRAADIDNCLDVDLEWSPSTNTLPIQRLALAIGESNSVSAAWVRFPSLEVQRLDQTYERLEDRRYRYRSGRFTADLAADEDGMVLQLSLIHI